MDSSIWIVLIIALTVIVVLYIFRDKLRSFSINANEKGINAELKAEQEKDSEVNLAASLTGNQATVDISGNTQIGTENKIDVGRDNVKVRDNLQYGDKQTIEVKPEEQDD